MIMDAFLPNKSRSHAFQAGLALLFAVLFASMTFSVLDRPVSFVFSPFIVLFLWPGKADPALSYFLIFLCGIFLDVLTGSPIGGWALIYLPFFILTQTLISRGDIGFGEQWFGFLMAMGAFAAFFFAAKLIRSLDMNFLALLRHASATILFFPVVYYLKNVLRKYLVSEDD